MAQLGVPSPIAPKACDSQDASVLRACARTCFPICLNRSIANQSNPIGQACNELMLQRGRDDRAACSSLLGSIPGKKEVVPAADSRPNLEACLKKAASGPALLDRLKSLQTAALRESLSRRLENPPPPSDCAPVPAALSFMYACIGAEAALIQEGYKSLSDRLGAPIKENQCDRSVSEYDQAYQILDGLRKRADYISNYSESRLSKCNSRWSEWLDHTSKTKNDQSDSDFAKTTATVAKTMNQLITGLQDELKRVVDTRNKAQITINNINDSLSNVEANVLSRLLTCN